MLILLILLYIFLISHFIILSLRNITNKFTHLPRYDPYNRPQLLVVNFAARLFTPGTFVAGQFEAEILPNEFSPRGLCEALNFQSEVFLPSRIFASWDFGLAKFSLRGHLACLNYCRAPKNSPRIQTLMV